MSKKDASFTEQEEKFVLYGFFAVIIVGGLLIAPKSPPPPTPPLPEPKKP